MAKQWWWHIMYWDEGHANNWKHLRSPKISDIWVASAKTLWVRRSDSLTHRITKNNDKWYVLVTWFCNVQLCSNKPVKRVQWYRESPFSRHVGLSIFPILFHFVSSYHLDMFLFLSEMWKSLCLVEILHILQDVEIIKYRAKWYRCPAFLIYFCLCAFTSDKAEISHRIYVYLCFH